MDRLNKDLDGILIIDELHSNIGIGALHLNHDTFFGGTDMIIRTAPEGNGTLLFIDTDYTLQDQNTRLSSEAGKPVFTSFKITNPTYQTGDLYFTYKTVGDFAEAADINELKNLLEADGMTVKEATHAMSADIATELKTTRTINGVSFNGSANITFGTLYPVIIPSEADLNNYTQPGMYYCPSNATVATLLNCPTSYAFSLLIEKHTGAKQTLTEYSISSPRIFSRNFDSSWGNWFRIYTTVDPPTQFQVSGNVGGSTSFSFLAEDSREIQRIGVSIPAGKQLNLKCARYYLGSASNIYLYIDAGGSGDWMSSTASGEDSPDTILYNNSTSSPVTISINVWLSSGQGSNITIQPYFAWCLDFSIE